MAPAPSYAMRSCVSHQRLAGWYDPTEAPPFVIFSDPNYRRGLAGRFDNAPACLECRRYFAKRRRVYEDVAVFRPYPVNRRVRARKQERPRRLDVDPPAPPPSPFGEDEPAPPAYQDPHVDAQQSAYDTYWRRAWEEGYPPLPSVNEDAPWE